MFSKVEDFANHLRSLLRGRGHSDYWSEVGLVIESLPIYATGDNYCFEIRSFESPRLFRRLKSLRGLSHEEVEQVLARGP